MAKTLHGLTLELNLFYKTKKIFTKTAKGVTLRLTKNLLISAKAVKHIGPY